jgi:hypothetical protein
MYSVQEHKADPIISFSALVIRSIDRNRTFDGSGNQTDTSSNFSLNINPELNGNYRIGNVSMYNTLYNITASNQTIFVFQSATQYSANLPVGIYNASNLPGAVATALNAIPGIAGTFSCSFSTTTLLLTITNSSTAFQMDFNNTNRIGCADLLGFQRSRSASSALTQTGWQPVNFNRYQSLFINIDQCASRYRNPLSSSPTIGAIHVPITQNSGDILQLKYSDFPTILSFNHVSTLNIQIRDSIGQIVNLGSEWEIQIIKL